MSTSKHIDKICIAVAVLIFILTLLSINAEAFGVSSVSKTMGYETTLFDTSKVHTIDIVMNDWDSFLETCENEEYSTCNVVIDGQACKNVAIRAKGNTSLSNVSSMDSDRYSLKLEFDHYEEGKTFNGLDKLCLNNLIQDNTMMKDYLVYQMMADYGVDAPLCSYAYITVNGEDWGLYLAVEGVEDSFLTRNYSSDDGNLYKPDTMSFGAGPGNGKDFDMTEFEEKMNQARGETDTSETTDSEETKDTEETKDSNSGNTQEDDSTAGALKEKSDEMIMPIGGPNGQNDPGGQGNSDENGGPGGQNGPFEQGGPGGFGGMGSDDVKLKYIDDDTDSYSKIFDSAKTDISNSDKETLIASLKNLSEYKDLEDTLDIEKVLRYFVVHNFVVNGDSYTGSMIHNYYLYEEDGKLSMIPWDYNLAFGTFQGGDANQSVNDSIDQPSDITDLNDRPMFGWIFSDEEYTNEYHELFEEFIEKYFTNGELEKMIDETAELIRPYVEKDPTKFCTIDEFDKGVETIKEFVSLRAEAVSRQLNGDDTEVDASSINTSDMGSMGSTGQGGGPGGFDGNMPDGFDGQMPGGFGGQPPEGFDGNIPAEFNDQPPEGFGDQPPEGFDGQKPEGI